MGMRFFLWLWNERIDDECGNYDQITIYDFENAVNWGMNEPKMRYK